MSTVVEIDHDALTEADIAAANAFANDIAREIRPDDPPIPVARTRARIRNMPKEAVAHEFWIRDDDGILVAAASAMWRDVPENRHLAWCNVEVRADRRGQGFGRELLRHVVDAVKADARSVLVGSTTDRIPSGEAFARTIGAEIGQHFHVNRLLFSDLDEGLVRRWIDDGPVRATGYSLVMVDGPFPDDVAEEAVRAIDIMNTAPLDDLDFEDQKMTVEEMRGLEKMMEAEGTERWVVFPRHDATGELVGLSEVFWNPSLPRVVNQGDTGVHPDHRGHALGKWMKAAMLERILRERPDVDQIRTGNADSNEAMLAINRELGFKPFIAHINWQLHIDAAEEYLDERSTINGGSI